jgi:hypothetical protein
MPPSSHQALLVVPSTITPSSSVSIDNTSSSPTPSATWFLDSGKSTHVTPDINALSYTQPYQGSDMVHIGNRSGLSIANTGITLLLTAAVPLQLTIVLHVPQIIKSLISVSQLTKDNKVLLNSHTSLVLSRINTPRRSCYMAHFLMDYMLFNYVQLLLKSSVSSLLHLICDIPD